MNNQKIDTVSSRGVAVQGADGAERTKQSALTTGAESNQLPKLDPEPVTVTVSSELVELLLASRVRVTEPVEPDEFLFSWGNVDFIPRQNILSIKAPAKSGKTFALTAFMLAFLTNNYYGLRSYASPTDRVLFIDTEQSRNDSRKILQRIKSAAHDQVERVDLFNIRNIDASKRLPVIEYQVQQSRPALIIIDGIADLIPGMDYNDHEAADKVITALSRIAEDYDSVVTTAIHTNKKDDFATGWLGRLLCQKCAVELAVKREAKSSTRRIEATVMRHREIESITFDIQDSANGWGEVKIISPDVAAAAVAENKRQEWKNKLLEWGIDKAFSLSRPEVCTMIREAKTRAEGKPCTPQNASNIVTRCLANGVLRQEKDFIVFEP